MGNQIEEDEHYKSLFSSPSKTNSDDINFELGEDVEVTFQSRPFKFALKRDKKSGTGAVVAPNTNLTNVETEFDVGDKIVSINGEYVDNLPCSEVLYKLKTAEL